MLKKAILLSCVVGAMGANAWSEGASESQVFAGIHGAYRSIHSKTAFKDLRGTNDSVEKDWNNGGLGGGFHAGYGHVFPGGLYLAGVFSYTQGGLSREGVARNPKSLVFVKGKKNYTHDMNLDLNIGGSFGDYRVYGILGLATLREKGTYNVMVDNIAGGKIKEEYLGTLRSKTRLLFGPRLGLGARALVAENLMVSLEASASFYSLGNRQSLALENYTPTADLVNFEGSNRLVNRKISLGVAYSFPVSRA
jgi:hypothetical protein